MISENEVLEYTDIEKLIRIGRLSPYDKLTNAVPGEISDRDKGCKRLRTLFSGHFPEIRSCLGSNCRGYGTGCACIASLTLADDQKTTLVFFATIDKTRFRQPVRPGDLFMLDVQKTASKANLWKFSGKANVDGKIVAQAEFSAMIVENGR